MNILGPEDYGVESVRSGDEMEVVVRLGSQAAKKVVDFLNMAATYEGVLSRDFDFASGLSTDIDLELSKP